MTPGNVNASGAYTPLQLAPKYLRYLMTAANGKGHGIHSPFVFDLVVKVLNDRTLYPEYRAIEALRRSLTRDVAHMVPTMDFGAGSGGARKEQTRSVASIARTALKPPKFGQLLFRLARYYKPETILELGTSLGITTAYYASGRPEASVTTMEGAPGIAAVAKATFLQLGNNNIALVEGNFDEHLEGVLSQVNSLDMAYVDGNHRMEPTLRYFRQMLPKIHEGSVLIFDDIHWSPEMEAAWEDLKNDPRVTCSVDLFYIGMLFFRKEFHVKQHFTIRF